MRYVRVLLPLLLTVVVVLLLDRPLGALPALGRLLDPLNGAMAAAEPTATDWNRSVRLEGLQAPVSVWLDTSLIPHLRAGNDHDLYYTQGYVHATFRLWQMDLQTRAAGGRISEVAGPKAVDFDRGMRREGMVWGAQHSLDAMEAEPRTKAMLDAYRDGINAFIDGLTYRSLPLEYKLMGFEPEPWTNLRTALLMKYMARDLTGKTDDVAFTQLRDQLGQEQFDFLFPERTAGSKPVIPEGTPFATPSLAAPPAPGDSVWAHFGPEPGTARSNGPVPAAGAGSKPSDSRLQHEGTGLHRLETNVYRSSAGSYEGGVSSYRSSASSYRSGASSHGGGAGSYKGDAGLYRGDAPVFNGGASPHKGDAGMYRSGARWYSRSAGLNSSRGDAPDGGESGIGSNNWAISGRHTASGKPILCNDPHLGLNLPALWFEMQLTAPGINAYGASLPGAPGIVIGFNEKIAWGFTNNYRDVKDFYRITPAEPYPAPVPRPYGAGQVVRQPAVRELPQEYVFNGDRQRFFRELEIIKVKGAPDFRDFVLYTVHGPVTYDPSFPGPDSTGALLACTWMGHRGSNELLSVYLLDRAGDYNAFTRAISHFECPAQNFAYADGAGNIAMWGQGRFINKWKGQGKYVMEGRDSSTLWGAAIPWDENPHVLNPPQGYVASANQQVTDSTYPYWYNQSATEWRSWEINGQLSRLAADNGLKAVLLKPRLHGWDSFYALPRPALYQDQLQNSVFSELMVKARPLTFFEGHHSEGEEWDYIQPYLNADSRQATAFQVEWAMLYNEIWKRYPFAAPRFPSTERTLQLMLSDSTSAYFDDPRTSRRETLRDVFYKVEGLVLDSLETLRKQHTDGAWYNVKNTTLTHLAKIPAFSYDHLKIGGWSTTINAVTGNHGPSWRMIVEMDAVPKAYTIYPGGQSGNPGSRHYGDFIDAWVEGRYHAVQFFTAAARNPLPYTWTLTP